MCLVRVHTFHTSIELLENRTALLRWLLLAQVGPPRGREGLHASLQLHRHPGRRRLRRWLLLRLRRLLGRRMIAELLRGLVAEQGRLAGRLGRVCVARAGRPETVLPAVAVDCLAEVGGKA